MRMNHPIEIEYPLSELEAGTFKNLSFNRENFNGDVGHYLRFAEDFPPLRFQFFLRPLIIDEAVPVDDLIFTIVDEDTGDRHPYNPHVFLHQVMDKLVPNPPVCS